jgi:predicted Zn-dependent protease
MTISRRNFVGHGLCACGLGLLAPPGWTRDLRIDTLTPLVTRDYQPQDLDERGMWDQCEKFEEYFASSNLRIKDPTFNAYLLDVMQRLLPEQADRIRVFPMWSADFNASMFPNGMMIVNSGFLARVRSEAQLAAVLGHECGHYLRRHSLQGWRNKRTSSAVMAFVAVGGAAVSGYTGQNWYDVANAINNGLLLSVFRYSRELESEADAYGLKLMAEARYAPQSASHVWKQLIEERKASAAARKKKYQDGSASAFSTHPPSEDRMGSLTAASMMIERSKPSEVTFDERRDAWRAATAAIRPALIDEQIKLNDPGASLYLIESQARDGWDATLRFYEGEVYRLRDEAGDAERAANSYAQAVNFPDAGPEAYRAHGYAQLKQGNTDAARRALQIYLDMKPSASDAEMVRFTLGQ